MRRSAFTLSEVLVTIGLLGVLATMTLPNLQAGILKSQIGPKLVKAVATFEQAHKTMLSAYDVNRLSDTGLLGFNTKQQREKYIQELSRYMNVVEAVNYPSEKISPPNYNDADKTFTKSPMAIQSVNGFVYYIYNERTNVGSGDSPANRDPVTQFIIDIDGNKGEGALASDLFVFYLMDDGSVIPLGSSFYSTTSTHWTKKCDVGKKYGDPSYCGAHILENNLRVLYKAK